MRLETELAWAAGLFDGEGSSSVTTRKKYNGIDRYYIPILQVEQSGNPAVLTRFKKAVGGIGTITLYKYDRNHYKARWRFVASWGSARRVMHEIYPYLSEVKQHQWDVVVGRCDRLASV